MSNKQQLLKDFVSQQIQNSKQQTQPIVNSDGFKNGEPPAGSNWRIPGDTLYNPTPYPIQAVSDNGITKTLNPFDESTVDFPGAKYVDEYQMRFGGLKKFLPGGFSIEPEPGPGPKPTPVKPDYSYMQTIYDKYATDYPMLKIGDLVPTRSRSAQSVDELKGNMMSTGTISLYGLEDLPPEIATKIVAEIDAENLKRNPKYTTKERGRGKTDMWTDPRLVKSYNKVFDNVYINADGQIAMPFKTQQPVFQDLPKPVEEVVAPTVIKPAEKTQTYQKTQPVYRMNYGQHKGQVQIGEDIWDDTSKKWKRVMFTPEQIQSSLEKGAIQKKDGGLNNYQNAGLVATSPYERIPQSWKEKYDWTPNVEEEYIRFKNDPNAPDNLRFTDDLNDYNVRGMWDSLERPVSWEQALTLYKDLNGEEWVPEEDGYYHAWSQHPGTGEWLKPKHHSTAWMNFAGYPMDPYSRVVVNPEGFFGDETLQTEYKKDGGLTKYQKGKQVSFDEYMMEGLRPQPAVQESTYRSVPIIEQERKDNAEGVTTKQKVQAAANRKKIAEEEKKEEIKKQLLDQGEIKPAPSEFDSNVAKAYYMVSNPMSALGHYARYGYVPQGNVGNYGLRYDQSPMEMIANSVNPFVWGNAAYRFTNDLADKNTYTTLGGAGNALFDALEATPMLGVMKSGVPSMLQDVSLAKSLANNKINQGISYLESKEGVFGRSPKLASIPESKTLGAPEMSRLADIESGMALQSSRLDPYQKLKKKIEFIESKPNLSEDDVVRMFGKSRKDLYDEFDVMEFNGGRPIEMTPPGSGRVSGLNLERPERSQASRDAQAARRANRQRNTQVRELNSMLDETLTDAELIQAFDESLPAYLRRNIQLDTSAEGLPRITIADPGSLDMEAIRNLMNAVVQKPTITRATDAVKGLFNSNPIYKGEVQKFMPSFHATDYATPRQMLMDVKSKLDQGLTGLRVGDVGTGSTNTSHNSYLNQMDFIAQNAGKQGLSKPVFLGYESMNPMGYLSNAAIPDDEIFKYINTKLNQIQQKRGVNFNLGQNAPYVNEAGSIMIPQYGVKKLDNSFTQIKKQEGGSVLKSFIMSQLQTNR